MCATVLLIDLLVVNSPGTLQKRILRHVVKMFRKHKSATQQLKWNPGSRIQLRVNEVVEVSSQFHHVDTAGECSHLKERSEVELQTKMRKVVLTDTVSEELTLENSL